MKAMDLFMLKRSSSIELSNKSQKTSNKSKKCTNIIKKCSNKSQKLSNKRFLRKNLAKQIEKIAGNVHEFSKMSKKCVKLLEQRLKLFSGNEDCPK